MEGRGTVRRTVLVVSNVFAPTLAVDVVRILKFVKYLPRFGWRPIVVPLEIRSPKRSEPKLLADVPPEASIVRPQHPFVRVIGDVVSYLRRDAVFGMRRGRYRAAVNALPRIARRFGAEVCLVTLPPRGLCYPALKAMEAGLRVVLDYRDPPAVFDPAEGAAKNPVKERFFDAAERDAIERAAAVILNTEAARSAASAAGLRRGSMFDVITNGYDEEEYAGLAGPPPEGPFTMLYAGKVYEVPQIATFLRGLELACSRDDAFRRGSRLIALGDTGMRALARGSLAASIIEERGWVPRAEVAAAIASAPACLLFYPPRWIALRVPLKLYEYLRGAREILAFVNEGAAASLIRTVRAGTVTNPNDPAAIAGELLRAFHVWRSTSAPAKDMAAILRYERKALTEQLAAILDRVADTRGCAS